MSNSETPAVQAAKAEKQRRREATSSYVMVGWRNGSEVPVIVYNGETGATEAAAVPNMLVLSADQIRAAYAELRRRGWGGASK